MMESNNQHSHLWKKLAGQLEDHQTKQVDEADTVDLAYKLEWLEVGQKGNIGTEPIKTKKKDKVQLKRRKFHIQRVQR